MNKALYLDGREYISASRASKKTGYASDYIGQLCRANKIPGQLIGRTWYVDADALIRYKNGVYQKKVAIESSDGVLKEFHGEPVIQHGESQSKFSLTLPLITLPRILEHTVFTYGNEAGPRLPELSKKSRYMPPVWTDLFVKKALASALSLIISLCVGITVFEISNPQEAVNVEAYMTRISSIPQQSLVSWLDHSSLIMGKTFDSRVINKKLMAAVSFLDNVDTMFNSIRHGFSILRQLVLDKISPVSEVAKVITISSDNNLVPNAVPVQKASTLSASSLNLNSFKSELKTELENYISIKVNSILSSLVTVRPSALVVSSSPVAVATDFTNFKTNEVIPITYSVVTRQSDSDASSYSHTINTLTSDGQFIKATFGTLCLSSDCRTAWPDGGGSSGSFAWTPTTWGVSTSTTLGFLNGFLSTASSTISGGLVVVGNSTTTYATTTNLFSTTASTTNFYGSGLVTCQSGNVLTYDGTGRFGCATDATGSSLAFPWTPTTWGVSTSTTLGFLNGFLSTASSTINSTLRLPTLSAGGVGIDATGLVYSGATTTAGTGLTYSGNAFNINTSQNIATLSSLTTNGFVKTSSGTGALSIDTTNYLSSYDAWTHPAYGGSATTSLLTITGGFLSTASSTINANLIITGNSTTTNATTTALAISSIASSLLKTNATGGIIPAIAGTDYVAGSSFFSFPWTPGTYGSTNVNATSTALQLQGGLFASSTVRFGNAGISSLLYDGTVGNLGLGTTTPFAKLSITGTSAQTNPLFQVASSTNSPLFTITSAGNVGIGTSSPYSTLSVLGEVVGTNFSATSTTATSTFSGGLASTGLSTFTNAELGALTFDTNAGVVSWIDLPVTSAASANTVERYTAQLAGRSAISVYGVSNGSGDLSTGPYVGIGGTTSPYALLSIATTTSTLMDLFVIASSTTSGIVFKVDSYGQTFADGAYSSPAADYAEYFYTMSDSLKSGEIVCVDVLKNNAVKRCVRGSDNNVMGIVSTKPAMIGNYTNAVKSDPTHHVIIGMLGQVDAFVSNENGVVNVGDSLTSSSLIPGYAMRASGGDSTVGIALEPMSASSGKIKVLISRRNKSLAVEEIEELVVERVANMKIEDSVNQMVQQSITDLNLDPTIVSIVESEVGQLNTEFASTTASLGLRLDHIESIFTSTTSIATSTPDSFGGYFLSNLFSSITAWLADATNGITDFFANRVRTKEICLSDSNGETCLTRQQLDTLLAGSNVALTPTTQDLPSSETNDSNSVEQLSTVASTTNETESLNMSSALIPSVVTEGATQ